MVWVPGICATNAVSIYLLRCLFFLPITSPLFLSHDSPDEILPTASNLDESERYTKR